MPEDNPKEELPNQKPPEKHQENMPGPEFFTPKMGEAEEIKTLLAWAAPSRPFRKKDRSYYTTIAILAILLVLIAFLAQEFLLIGVIMSFAFVAYVLAFVPPHTVNYKISTQGITIGEDFYFWHYLESFWFKEKDGLKVLHIQTFLRFPAQIMLVIEKDKEDEIKKIVARFLPFQEKPFKSWLEKWSESLQKHFPLENIHR